MAQNDRRTSSHNPEAERIERWRWMLEQNVPIIGGWMHRRVTSALIDSAESGNWLAAQSLAVVFAFHEDEEVRQMAGETLRKIQYATGIDAVWGVWAETRHPELGDIAMAYQRPASQPPSVRLLSLLYTNQVQAVTHGSAELVPALVQAATDKDPVIASRAREAIHSLHSQQSIDMLCQMWRNTRNPFLESVVLKAKYVAQKPDAARVLSALKTGQIEPVLQSSAGMVPELVRACEDPDVQIADQARQCLPMLQSTAAVNAFCKQWSETRDPRLEAALLQAGYRASSPAAVRMLTALKLGHQKIPQTVDPSALPHLLQAVHDVDEVIRTAAREALLRLAKKETQEALCLRVIEQNDSLAAEIAIKARYEPQQPQQRALFFFLTGQWEDYDALDFDQSLLRAIYEASPSRSEDGRPNLRHRIAAQVQAAGRTDYLTILAGVDYRERAEQVTPGEAALLVRVLAENHEFSRMWRLAPELALPFSLEILQILSEQSWRPETESDHLFFDELTQLARQPVLLDPAELARSLPLAIPRATVKVHGRINDAAFAPNQPVLAIATSQRKTVLWNFQAAAIQRIVSDFKHSVGRVAYTQTGRLVAAERTNTGDLCTVVVQNETETFNLCAHTGTVTVLEPLGADQLLTAGRDQRVFVWDLEQKRKITEKEFAFWPRSAATSPDLQYAALLHDRLSLARLPDLSLVPGYPYLQPRSPDFKAGVAQNAAFAPDGKFILTGQHNGQVGLYFHTSQTQRPRKAVLTRHNGPVRGIHFLPGHPMVISAGAEGHVRFFRWPEMAHAGSVYAPEGQLTSLRISRNGAFMATGASDASLMLWDLRVLDIPRLFTQPLATATHDQITTVMALSEYHSLPDPIRNGLRILRLLLQYRFRFDIHLEEGPAIQFGEFDILLEEG
jgi:hypothetical protein